MISADATAALARLRSTPERMLELVMGAVKAGAAQALGTTLKERFRGNSPQPYPVADRRLRAISRRLSSSILLHEPTATANEVTAVIGTNVKYFARHEYGLSRPEDVRAHARKLSRLGTKVVKNSRKDRKGAKTLITRTTVQVKAHTRHPNLPARMPLRTGLGEHLTRSIYAEMERRVGRMK